MQDQRKTSNHFLYFPTPSHPSPPLPLTFIPISSQPYPVVCVSLYQILSLHCSFGGIYKEPLKPQSYILLQRELFALRQWSMLSWRENPVWSVAPSFTLTIMLLALSCPRCKAHVFPFCPALSLPHALTPPPGFPLLCHSLSSLLLAVHCEEKPSKMWAPLRHAGKCSWSLRCLFSVSGV